LTPSPRGGAGTSGPTSNKDGVASSWQGQPMGHAYDAFCKECGTKFEVSEGSGMIAMQFH
jgi:hypothetical protein